MACKCGNENMLIELRDGSAIYCSCGQYECAQKSISKYGVVVDKRNYFGASNVFLTTAINNDNTSKP